MSFTLYCVATEPETAVFKVFAREDVVMPYCDAFCLSNTTRASGTTSSEEPSTSTNPGMVESKSTISFSTSRKVSES